MRSIQPRPEPSRSDALSLSFEGVSMRFPDGTEALDDVSLRIGQGEFVSIVGPSGCGKSTLLKIASGLFPHTSGTVRVDRTHLGYTFQDATLLPWRKVLGNVELLMELRGYPPAERRRIALEQISLVGLDGFADHYPKRLSGGMRMRVSIARALVTRPPLLLMDEPFAALDEITRFRLNDDLLNLWETFGWTVVFVTHSVFESVYLSNRIVVMAARPGRIHSDLAIDAPYPRSEQFRMSEAYNEYCRRTSDALHAAMEASAP